MEKKYEPRMLMGRLASGLQSDHGSRVHACMPGKVTSYGGGTALCGAKPGPRSCGWSPVEKDRYVDCRKCLTKIGSMSFMLTTYWKEPDRDDESESGGCTNE